MALEALYGREIVLSIRNVSAASTGPFADTVPKSLILAGTVLNPREFNHDNDFIAFQLPKGEQPLRLIHYSLIQTINGRELVEEKRSSRKWEVPSTSGDEIYIVREKNGQWSCTCIANSNFRRVCKHIKLKRGD